MTFVTFPTFSDLRMFPEVTYKLIEGSGRIYELSQAV